ncbi:hypothetical protein JTB14_021117 [Gonioctena quinquepunctata]|nr:hypothetical protein JTB14_021117 [Gonioctena quinquepunctata]
MADCRSRLQQSYEWSGSFRSTYGMLLIFEKIFYYSIDAAIVNSFILFNPHLVGHNKKSKPQIEYRKILANQLIEDYTNRSTLGRKSTEIRRNKLKRKSGRTVTVKSLFSSKGVGDHSLQTETKRR